MDRRRAPCGGSGVHELGVSEFSITPKEAAAFIPYGFLYVELKAIFHELRHTFQLATGERPKGVQEILEHSSIKIIMDTCSHVIPGKQEEAAGCLQRLLFGPTPVRPRKRQLERRRTARKSPFAGLLGAHSAGLEPATF